MTTDPIAAAIDHICSVTNRAWCAEDFGDSPNNSVDASIATILNAVSEGQLINRASRDEMLAQVRRGEGFATAGAEARWIADSEAGAYDTDAPDPIAAARALIATLADAVEAERAKVAAAYEAGQLRMRELCGDMVEREGHGLHVAIRYAPLTPADAQAALDKLLAEARLEGWRAGRDAAAEYCWARRDGLADAEQKKVAAGLTGHVYYGRRLEAELLTRAIHALPEPKEASHG